MNRILFYRWERDKWLQNSSAVDNQKLHTADFKLALEPNALSTSTTLHIPMHDIRAQHIKQIIKTDSNTMLLAGIIHESVGILKIIRIDSDEIEVMYISKKQEDTSSYGFEIHMVLAHIRPSAMIRVLKDLTSMGVSSINVFISKLTEKSYSSSRLWKDKDTILLMGAMQGGYCTVPQLELFYSLQSALNTLDSKFLDTDTQTPQIFKLVCHQTSSINILDFMEDVKKTALQNYSNTDAHNTYKQGSTKIILTIGPERGLTDFELELLYKNNYIGVSLGQQILRSETASTVCTGIANNVMQQKYRTKNLL